MTEEVKKEERSLNFLEEIIEDDLKNDRYKQIITRFRLHPFISFSLAIALFIY